MKGIEVMVKNFSLFHWIMNGNTIMNDTVKVKVEMILWRNLFSDTWMVLCKRCSICRSYVMLSDVVFSCIADEGYVCNSTGVEYRSCTI